MVYDIDKHRQAVELLYTDTCDIYQIEYIEPSPDNGYTGEEREVKTHSNQKCKLSYNAGSELTLQAINKSELVIDLYLPPDLNVEVGSRVVVTRPDKQKLNFAYSGISRKYTSHQVIVLSTTYSDRA